MRSLRDAPMQKQLSRLDVYQKKLLRGINKIPFFLSTSKTIRFFLKNILFLDQILK